ncbi:uncharacterized protein [Amphiura filiformis]|uniref:uncharacterized protein n=1 Tax=Amphiura filiformis TaxID=82378 RepID=UPI003B2257E5
MGGPKINTSYRTMKNRLGRMANKAKSKGGGKRQRKRLHHAKKAKNVEKKMRKYYGDLASGAKQEEPDKQQMSRGRPKLTGKKMRKIRKRMSQSRDRMEVEIEVTTKDKKNKDKKSQKPPSEASEDSNYEDVEMDDE